MDFLTLRNTYKNFIYHDYKISETNQKIIIEYKFEIEKLETFYPKIEIIKKNFIFKNINTEIVKNMIFNLGMIEAISYFKATCSENFIIKCGSLDKYQEKWFRKIFYLGLGEFRYINNIEIDEKEFVNFISEGEKIEVNEDKEELDGIIIPIGGGKDSNVTMELLKRFKSNNLCFRIGMNEVVSKCAEIGGYDNDKIVEVVRTIDKNLIELNKKGFLNGHTPFSAMVAFLSYTVSYLLGKKYIALSNESSANESNVEGKNINHQYSKTIEFENDFREYYNKYLKTNVEYFSMLRPMNELQIAMIFSKFQKYHQVFKSCNPGSKEKPWIWCGNCPKCLFVYIMLSPFLYKEKLINIFKQDLFEREDLLKTFTELCGYGENKPFECVGTYEEIRYAVTKTINQIDEKLPYLLEFYKNNFALENKEMLNYFNTEHNLPEEFEKILKEELGIC